MPRKIDTNPLLPFTYDDLLRIIEAEKNKASGVAGNNARGRCNRRSNAGRTLNDHSSVAALSERGECFMDMRELKGLEIAARSRIAFKDGVWLVSSQSSTRMYNVILKPGEESCNCEDFTLHRHPCKHIHAARFVRERDGGG